MADEQTPMSPDDAVDPLDHSGESQPGQDGARSQELADQARRSRPRRRTGPPQDAAPTDAPEPELTRSEDQSNNQGATAAPAPRSAPRPVRRSTPAAVEPDEQAPASSGSTAMPRPVRRTVQTGGELDATPRGRKGRQVQTRSKRTTPAAFVGQSADELRKVIWPTGAQLAQYFVVVLVFVLFIVAYVGLLDPAFGWVLLRVFGK